MCIHWFSTARRIHWNRIQCFPFCVFSLSPRFLINDFPLNERPEQREKVKELIGSVLILSPLLVIESASQSLASMYPNTIYHAHWRIWRKTEKTAWLRLCTYNILCVRHISDCYCSSVCVFACAFVFLASARALCGEIIISRFEIKLVWFPFSVGRLESIFCGVFHTVCSVLFTVAAIVRKIWILCIKFDRNNQFSSQANFLVFLCRTWLRCGFFAFRLDKIEKLLEFRMISHFECEFLMFLFTLKWTSSAMCKAISKNYS